jgi:hypothetical protein
MSDLFKEFKKPYENFTDVVEQCVQLAKDHDLENMWTNPNAQLAIQTTNSNLTNWSTGTGASPNKSKNWEKEFCYIHPDLKNSPVDNYLSWLGVPVYRTRLMLSRERSCYSIHKDYSPRLHLPLVTNDQCKFLFTDPVELISMPADGRTFWTDTRKPHTFINCSNQQRLHLVMIVDEMLM